MGLVGATVGFRIVVGRVGVAVGLGVNVGVRVGFGVTVGVVVGFGVRVGVAVGFKVMIVGGGVRVGVKPGVEARFVLLDGVYTATQSICTCPWAESLGAYPSRFVSV